MATSTKDDAIRELERAWTALRSLIESVPEEELTAGGVVEQWSIKDLLGHMAFWSERAAVSMKAANAGKPEDIPRGKGEHWVDEWNEREYLARKDKPFENVRGEWIKAHENARKELEATTEVALDMKSGPNKVIEEFAWDTYAHYDQHAEQIKAWLREMETTEK